MTDRYSNPEDIFKKVSRRYLLRNSAIAATGAVLLPSFITGCNKDDPQGSSVGGVSLSQNDLKQAAANLTLLRAWVTDLYPLCIEYEDAAFHALADSKNNTNWTNFIVDVFIDIAYVIAGTAAVLTGGAAAAAVPAIACLSSFLHDWGIGKDKPNNLDDEFAAFEIGHNAMQLAIEQKLSSLVDPANNYSNLTNAWKDNIEFNGSTYTIGDLASSNFPGLGDDYNRLQTAAYTSFKKMLWNLVIMKCCTYYENIHYSITLYQNSGPHSVTEYAQQQFYPSYKGLYLRGLDTFNDPGNYRDIDLVYWNLGINGYSFPDQAINMLFMDDTPGHIINPDGLFNRHYVFQQFSKTKYTRFLNWHELAYDPKVDFSLPDDWNFTGGMFPKLTM